MVSRYLPINWIPRWMDANYDTDSTLRKIYFLGIIYWADHMQSILNNAVVPQFFGDVRVDRQGWIAKYHYPQDHIPPIVLHTTSSSSIISADSLGSMLYERVRPIYTKTDTHLYLKNLEIKAVSLSTSSGILTFSISDMTNDSEIIIENEWGDQTILDLSDQRFYNGTIDIGYTGNFILYYKSQAVVDALISGQYYITIDEEIIPIKSHYFHNTWDEYGSWKLLERNGREDNEALKARCQSTSLSKKLEQKISASLGQCQLIMWDTTNSLSLVGSGVQSYNFINYPGFQYIEEQPIKVDQSFYLSAAPSGYVQIFLNGRRVDPDTYTVSGSRIIPNPSSSLFLDITQENVKVKYKHQVYNTVSRAVTSIQVQDESVIPALGIISKGVRVTNSTKKIDVYKWNIDRGLLSGLADFDF